jgi:tetratricopeptide (TPR) repeat protein
MDVKTLTYLLENPGEITSEQTREIEKILVKAPYFQAARAIRLKGLKEHQEFSYNDALKKTAAYTTDRSILFEFITSEEFNQNQIAKQIRDQEERLKEMVVYEPEVVHGRRSIDINEAIKMKQSESERVLDPALFERPVHSEQEEAPKKIENEAAEDKLGLGKPLEFDGKESHSFSEWLKLTKAQPIEREDEEIEDDNSNSRLRKFELIEEFISKNPKIKPGKTPNKANLAEQSITGPESLMTETLAKVYLEQKNYKKAIQAYKILILKNPEKSGFFADQIRAIEKLQDTNNE